MEKKNCIKKDVLKNQKGITLIVLIVTIMVMVILAAVSIDAINDGLFDSAQDAKRETIKAQDIQIISTIYIKVKGNSKTGRITETELTNETSKYQDIEQVTEQQEDHSFIIEFSNGNEYILDQQGNIEEK